MNSIRRGDALVERDDALNVPNASPLPVHDAFLIRPGVDVERRVRINHRFVARSLLT